jgi:hypothetical protein
MIHAREKLGKKLIFLLAILGVAAAIALSINPSNIFIIIVMNIVVSSFFFFLLRMIISKKLAFTGSFPIFLILTLLSLKLFDLLNIILVISLSIAIGLLIK